MHETCQWAHVQYSDRLLARWPFQTGPSCSNERRSSTSHSRCWNESDQFMRIFLVGENRGKQSLSAPNLVRIALVPNSYLQKRGNALGVADDLILPTTAFYLIVRDRRRFSARILVTIFFSPAAPSATRLPIATCQLQMMGGDQTGQDVQKTGYRIRYLFSCWMRRCRRHLLAISFSHANSSRIASPW